MLHIEGVRRNIQLIDDIREVRGTDERSAGQGRVQRMV